MFTLTHRPAKVHSSPTASANRRAGTGHTMHKAAASLHDCATDELHNTVLAQDLNNRRR
jgi:hypothetical protein